jgi:DNA-binding response OmpR family regulator
VRNDFSAKGALEWLAVNTPSIAIVDFTLADGPCTTLTRALRQREIPFVIYSGHKRSVAPAELQDVPWLTKPCDRLALLATLHGMLPALRQQTETVAA